MPAASLSPSYRRWITALALVCLWALAACGGSSPAATSPTSAPTDAPASEDADVTPEATTALELVAPEGPMDTIDGVFVGDYLPTTYTLTDFSMPSTRGADFSFSDMNGKWRLVFFGYTHCPDFCPLTLAEFRIVKQALGEAAENVEFVFISVDGSRDSQESLTEYMGRFDPEFVGMSGTDEVLAQIQPDWGFYYRRRVDTNTSADYLVDHSTRSYLVDPDGVLTSSFTYDTAPDAIAAAVAWWIENGSDAGRIGS
ncbi:MAG: SCO family protein [Pleurocapsa minor GSE-CHR-MK-17-07R]|jgi:protein SCO1/2|nr:SCO family protein [Pleurocapsa minor GSE-CHR-MK 17-07R]